MVAQAQFNSALPGLNQGISMYRTLAVLTAALLIACPSLAGAEEQDHEALHVAHGWARASLGQNPNSVAYVTLHNKSEVSDTLLGVNCAAAQRCSLHAHVTKDDISSMEAVGSLEVPAGAHVEFKPGGYHIMMFDLKSPLAPESETSVTFTFEHAGDITATMPVLSMREAAKRTHHGEHH